MNASPQPTDPSATFAPERIAELACDALLLELRTYPKPGLVSHVDRGSHADMDAATFEVSVAAIQPFFRLLAEAGAEGAEMGALRPIGLDAEAAMMRATSGINTHRGAIFGLGLLCAAAGARTTADRRPLGTSVALRWGPAIARGPIPLHSHGGDALRQYGAGGARAEAAAGFPALYRVGLPALRHGRRLLPNDAEASRVQCLFALMATVEDTNLLHRGGASGAHFARDAAVSFLAAGGIARSGWHAQAIALHEAFVARRLSAGGCADLLAMSLFVDAVEAE